MTESASQYTLGEIAAHLDSEVVGDPSLAITGLGSLGGAGPGELSHYSSAAYRAALSDCRASALLLRSADRPLWPGSAIVVDDPYLAFAKVSQMFRPASGPGPGIDPSAQVHPEALVDVSASVGPGCIIGADTRIGAGVRLHGNVSVADSCRIDDDAELMWGVVVYAGVTIGPRSRIHANAVLGSDGFGFAPDRNGVLHEIAQLGGLTIGADVRIGAGTSIDCGAIDDTVIEDGVKIDNQVQIGHNCRVGAHTVICGCVGIVGSTQIGRHCVIAGGAGIGGGQPITICDGVTISGMTHVSASIDEPGVYSGGVLHNESRQWKRNAIRFQSLDALARRIAKLEADKAK